MPLAKHPFFKVNKLIVLACFSILFCYFYFWCSHTFFFSSFPYSNLDSASLYMWENVEQLSTRFTLLFANFEIDFCIYFDFFKLQKTKPKLWLKDIIPLGRKYLFFFLIELHVVRIDFSDLKISVDFLMWVGGLLAFMSVHSVHPWCLQRPK